MNPKSAVSRDRATKGDEEYHLREDGASYMALFEPKKGDIATYFLEINTEESTCCRVLTEATVFQEIQVVLKWQNPALHREAKGFVELPFGQW